MATTHRQPILPLELLGRGLHYPRERDAKGIHTPITAFGRDHFQLRILLNQQMLRVFNPEGPQVTVEESMANRQYKDILQETQS